MRNRVPTGRGCSQDGLSRCSDRCLDCNSALLRYQPMLVAVGVKGTTRYDSWANFMLSKCLIAHFRLEINLLVCSCGETLKLY